ncbi:hypothetical protein F5B22DRAFT_620394 [Xylaria bambusicola]|uniref:uncharacterized protein n=1 Tax=Xylaria bambusicola TaxID=326684 RepID=UPI0020074DF0|nr:uncharacterized protein F5B22DRAFT_620394 [Xylaria bambusicola]KAI0508589.1 hypothetical protein F5B22DRAFT_620394 [Xylaria bambusicola]
MHATYAVCFPGVASVSLYLRQAVLTSPPPPLSRPSQSRQGTSEGVHESLRNALITHPTEWTCAHRHTEPRTQDAKEPHRLQPTSPT